MTHDDTSVPIFGIIPAAGVSRRMGIAKQTLPFGNSTVTGRVVRTMLKTDVRAIIVITRTELLDTLDAPRDDRVQMIINNDPKAQMIDSVRLGLAHLIRGKRVSRDAVAMTGVLVIPGDMPTVSTAACDACIDAFHTNPTRIVLPIFGGKRGHPIIFPMSLRTFLDQLDGGLNQLPLHHKDRVVEVGVNDPGILRDIDTRADYNALQPE